MCSSPIHEYFDPSRYSKHFEQLNSRGLSLASRPPEFLASNDIRPASNAWFPYWDRLRDARTPARRMVFAARRRATGFPCREIGRLGMSQTTAMYFNDRN